MGGWVKVGKKRVLAGWSSWRKVREARLRWFGHLQRIDSEYFGGRMLKMELPGRRERRFMDDVKEDIDIVGLTEEDAEDRE